MFRFNSFLSDLYVSCPKKTKHHVPFDLPNLPFFNFSVQHLLLVIARYWPFFPLGFKIFPFVPSLYRCLFILLPLIFSLQPLLFFLACSHGSAPLSLALVFFILAYVFFLSCFLELDQDNEDMFSSSAQVPTNWTVCHISQDPDFQIIVLVAKNILVETLLFLKFDQAAVYLWLLIRNLIVLEHPNHKFERLEMPCIITPSVSYLPGGKKELWLHKYCSYFWALWAVSQKESVYPIPNMRKPN